MLEKILQRDRFSQVLNGKQCDLFILKNKKGSCVAITNYGARIVGLSVPDKTGQSVDVVMGFDSLDRYLQAECSYHGATIGRFANRIAGSEFFLNDKKYTLLPNEGVNHLHGGPHGFHNVVWSPTFLNSDTIELHYHSKDNEEGYPGNLSVKIRFHFNEENDLRIDYEAKSDELTILNLTNHSFFNLNGENNETIDNHFLQINADYYTPINDQLIPLGTIEEVEGTPFDFRKRKTIGTHIDEDHDQLKKALGYDHNFVLSPLRFHGINEALRLHGDKSGIEMIVYTSEPGLQFYSGNFMKGTDTFKGGMRENYRTALALETQHFPDSPNHNNFTETTLSPEQTFYSTSIYQFRTKI
jgi:aldose 1-epimerase